jgi:phage tail sheath protein FI
MPTYLSPGVYVEEVSTGPRPIEAVGTSTAGFVGVAPNAQAYENQLRWLYNWSQFLKDFVAEGNSSTPLSNAVYGFFLNGGSRCCVVNVGAGTLCASTPGRRKGLDLLEETDEVAIVAAPGFSDAASYDALLTHCEKRKNRVAVLDGPPTVNNLESLTKISTAKATRKPAGNAAASPAPPAGSSPASAASSEADGLRPRQSDGGFGAIYFPWITIRDPLEPAELVDVAPSGHVAGIYARSDATRGVHKAPANEIVRGALNVTYRVTREEQGALNPNGVNCVRLFPNEGIRLYGARTVAASSSDYRYLNIRRLLNQIEESIARNTGWVVFEPNDRPLWKSIVRDVSAFLTLLWRKGALLGRTPEEAFFVKCDEETNPKEVIDAGQVVTMIGVAPVKPAEFVIFRIGQGAGGAQVEAKPATAPA